MLRYHRLQKIKGPGFWAIKICQNFMIFMKINSFSRFVFFSVGKNIKVKHQQTRCLDSLRVESGRVCSEIVAANTARISSFLKSRRRRRK